MRIPKLSLILWLMKNWLRYSRLQAKLNFQKYIEVISTSIYFYHRDPSPIICKQTLFFLILLFRSIQFSSSSFSFHPFNSSFSFNHSSHSFFLVHFLIVRFITLPSSFCHCHWWLYFFWELSQCFFWPSYIYLCLDLKHKLVF